MEASCWIVSLLAPNRNQFPDQTELVCVVLHVCLGVMLNIYVLSGISTIAAVQRDSWGEKKSSVSTCGEDSPGTSISHEVFVLPVVSFLFSLCDGFLESQAGDSEMVFMILHMMVSHNSVNLSFQVQSFLRISICPTVVLFNTPSSFFLDVRVRLTCW